MIPKWRYVQYTDDGSAEFQCLNCYNAWDARTSPGWFNDIEYVTEPTHDSMTITQDGVNRHFRVRKPGDEVYNPVWTFCPYCGVQWTGPVRSDVYNERMLGPRRLKIQQAMNSLPLYVKPSFWWVIQESTITVNGDGTWYDKEYAKGICMPAIKMLYLLRDTQARLEADNNDWCVTEARLIVKHTKPKGHEIHNYEWDYTKQKATDPVGEESF